MKVFKQIYKEVVLKFFFYKYQFQVEKAKNIMWDKWKEVGKKIVKVSYFPIPSFVKIHLREENWFIGKRRRKKKEFRSIYSYFWIHVYDMNEFGRFNKTVIACALLLAVIISHKFKASCLYDIVGKYHFFHYHYLKKDKNP